MKLGREMPNKEDTLAAVRVSARGSVNSPERRPQYLSPNHSKYGM